ncbi:MAG: HEAT repeat domain-containing protein [Spirochaetota bacterium]|nr:HEAT repeat domain-containing protein [Spirochaetota bacterium]
MTTKPTVIQLIALICLTLSACVNYRFDHIRESEANNNDDFIIEALNKSEDPYIRAQAAQSLGRMKSKKAIPSLIKALKDDTWSVRLYVAQALGEIGATKAIRPLKDQLKAENEEHVIKAIKAAIKKIRMS